MVTAHGAVPNANHPELRDLLYGEGAAAGSTVEERRAELRRRGDAGTLPVIEFSQRVDLVREGEHWKVFLDWAVGFTIRFRAEVREQLPFEFSVEPESITLKPGETGSAVFRARNASDATVKAKAGHLFEPPVAFLHTELLQCFCFFEDTYAPGEERELPVAIRSAGTFPPTSAKSRCSTSTTRWRSSRTAVLPRRAMNSSGNTVRMTEGYSDRELEAMMADLESDLVERKESLRGDSAARIREAVCAFANDLPDHRRPGVVFVGADDAGDPTGLDITDQLLCSSPISRPTATSYRRRP